MKKEKQFWNCGFKNKKAFIFTMDVMVAAVIVLSTLTVASYFVVQKSSDPFPSLHLLRTGSDFVKLLDYMGYFNDPSGGDISTYLVNYLPQQYGMYLEGSGPVGSTTCIFTAGENPPEGTPLGSGKEFFRTSSKEHCSVRYKIWLK